MSYPYELPHDRIVWTWDHAARLVEAAPPRDSPAESLAIAARRRRHEASLERAAQATGEGQR